MQLLFLDFIISIKNRSYQISGGAFNYFTGEYELKEGRDVHIVVDLERIKITGKDDGKSKKSILKDLISLTVEEGVHATQNYIDLGKYFKNEISPGFYFPLLNAELLSRFMEVGSSGAKTDANYNSQRNETEAKVVVDNAVNEIK